MKNRKRWHGINALWRYSSLLIVLFGLLQPTEGNITGPLSVSVAEEQTIGSVITGLFTATDAVSYSLTGSDTGYFQINAASGVVRVIARLDRDGVGARTVFNDLLLTVTDSGSVSHSASLNITITDINDNVPKFSPAVYFVSVDENTPAGQNLVTLACSDPDEVPGNGDITYAIVGGDDATPKFTLSSNRLETSTNSLDYEALLGQSYMYQLVITATDGGVTPHTGTASIIVQVNAVNELDPVWGSFSPAYIDATTPYTVLEELSPGATVVTVTATDGDHAADGLLMYSLISILDDGGNTASGVFRLDPVSGKLMTSVQLDADSPSSALYYDVVVRASDLGLPSRSVDRALRVGISDVNDNAPEFSQSLYRVTAMEGVAVGSSLLTLMATDSDPSSTLSYSIIQGNGAAKFVLSAGPELQIQSLINLDLPTNDPGQYELVIQAVDGGTPVLTGSTTVVITVLPTNDYDPVFVPPAASYVVPENTAGGYLVTTVSATDQDYGTHGTLFYSILSGGLGYFYLGRATGALKLYKQVDFESLSDSVIPVVVVVSDAGGRTDTATVTVSIADVNDHSPTCSSTAFLTTLNEDTFNGTVIDLFTLTCADADLSDSLSFSISSGDPTASFSLTSAGVLQLVKALDYESTPGYNLWLEVSDGTYSEQVQAVVSVLPVNEALPTFSSPTVSVSWPEDTTPGTTLATYPATDLDSGLHGTVTYSVTTVSQGGGSLFEMDSSGNLLLLRWLDYEGLPAAEKYYSVVVSATDGAGAQGLGTVSVMVTDVNDNSPSCYPTYRQVTVAENTAVGLPLTLVSGQSCSDPDPDPPAGMAYTMTQVPGGSQFTVGSTDGSIRLTSALDYELEKQYTLYVIVSDSGTPVSQSSTVTVAVSVTNVNDGPPVLLNEYVTNVFEDMAVGYSVFDVVAQDPDDPSTPEGRIVYTLTSGNFFEQFHLDSNTGRISVNTELDRERKMFFRLHIRATEVATSYSIMTAVNISVDDANDNYPTCPSYVIDTSVSEGSPIHTSVMVFSCVDSDGTVITYTMKSGDTSVFQMFYASFILKSTVDYESGPKFYDLVITASDGLYERDLYISVKVTPVNEDPPVFTVSGSYSVTVPEDTIPGSHIVQVSAADPDEGPDGQVAYSMMAHSKFLLNTLTGEITLQNYLNFETEPALYTLVVTATDLGVPAQNVTATVDITVTNVNEHSPVFTPRLYSGFVVDNSAVGTTVLSLTSTDLDSDVFGEVSYSILSGNTGGVFLVEKDSLSGECRLIVNDVTFLDEDTLSFYDIRVQASDGGGKVAEATVLITVTPVNEFAPVFTISPNPIFLVTEDTPVSTAVVTILATDADSGPDGTVTYSLALGTVNKFIIDPTTGILSVSGLLDAESVSSYTLEVLAVDGDGLSSLSSNLSLTIQVGDSNDRAPVCLWSSYSVTIPESVPMSSPVTPLPCTDSDVDSPNNQLTFTVSGGTGAGLFTVDSATGMVTTADVYDRETQTNYSLSVQVADQGSPSLTADLDLLIVITDENDNSPLFCCSPYAIAIDEDVPVDQSVLQIVATDLDEGEAGRVIYSIALGNTGNKFAVNGFTGEIKTNGWLDREAVASYTLVILARDAGAPPRTGTATLTIDLNDTNDNAPHCTTSLYQATVAKNVPLSHPVLNMSCSDADPGTNVTYALQTTGVPFSVEGSTGVVSVSAYLNSSSLTTYTLSVSVSDGLLSTSITLLIEVLTLTEEAPVFSPPGPYTVNMVETDIQGTIVLLVNATAFVTDHIVSFTITGGNIGGAFQISPLSGLLQTRRQVDYESIKVYQLEITVTDVSSTGLVSSSATVTINLMDTNDNPPVCNNDQVTAKVSESYSGALLSLNCTDMDASSTLTYRILSGNTHNSFILDSNTAELATGATLDFENTTRYDISVESSDGVWTAIVFVKVIVEPVNEYDPVFSAASYQVTVSEATLPGTSVFRVTATDLDDGDHGSLRYSIVSGNSQNKIVVDRSLGVLTVTRKLDREQTPSHSLLIHAVDSLGQSPGARTASVWVTVTVEDSNDNFPVFTPLSYLVTVAEGVPGGSTLLTITATDDDLGANGYLTLAIMSGNAAGIFNMTGNAVEIAPGQSLDYETAAFHLLVVEARDNGTVPKVAQAPVSISVLPVNEFSPSMVLSNLTVSLPEDTPVGTVIFTANATDGDKVPAGDMVYSIIAGNTPGSPFFINQLTGIVQVSSALDFDSDPTVYTLEILAQDDAGSGSGFSTTTTLSVILTDVADQTPVFTSNSWSFTMEENVNVSSPIGTVVAVDMDTGVGGVVSYALSFGDPSLFVVDNVTGQVSTTATGVFDYENQTLFSLMVSATDSGSPPRSSQCLVYVSLTDLNDNPPVFPAPNLTMSVSEDAFVGSFVMSAQATDEDSGSNGLLSYSLSTTTHFTIDQTSGSITTSANFDRETNDTYVIEVMAVDQGLPLLSATCTVTVIVQDVNDHIPVINGTYSFVISEDTTPGVIVTTVIASDDVDINENAILMFDIVSGNINNVWSIESKTGVLKVSGVLDREAVDMYSLTVRVSDQGQPPLSASVTVTVSIEDVNDNPPVFLTIGYSFAVREDVPPGYSCGSIAALDSDTGLSGQLEYSLFDIEAGYPDFSVNPVTGDILSVNSLDRETVDEYVLVFRATDKGLPRLFGETRVTITVTDVNDNSPVFTGVHSASVMENSAVNTSVLQLSVTDPDLGLSGAVTLSIDTTRNGGLRADQLLTLNSDTQILSTKAAIDRETDPTLDFFLTAHDQGLPSLTSSVAINVSVLDDNDNAPVMEKLFETVEIAYGGQCAEVLTTGSATDADLGLAATVTYLLNDTSNIFSVNVTSGEVELTGMPENDTTYLIDIKAQDSGVPVLTSVTPMVLRVDCVDLGASSISLALTVSKDYFLEHESTFLNGLTSVFQTRYPSAVAKRWCVEDKTPIPSKRRRLLQTGETVVVVNIFVLQNNVTSHGADVSRIRQLVSTVEAMDLLVANLDGSPVAALSAGGMADFGVFYVAQYKPVPVIEETVSAMTIGFSVVGALGFLVVAAAIIFCSMNPHKSRWYTSYLSRNKIKRTVLESRVAGYVYPVQRLKQKEKSLFGSAPEVGSKFKSPKSPLFTTKKKKPVKSKDTGRPARGRQPQKNTIKHGSKGGKLPAKRDIVVGHVGRSGGQKPGKPTYGKPALGKPGVQVKNADSETKADLLNREGRSFSSLTLSQWSKADLRQEAMSVKPFTTRETATAGPSNTGDIRRASVSQAVEHKMSALSLKRQTQSTDLTTHEEAPSVRKDSAPTKTDSLQSQAVLSPQPSQVADKYGSHQSLHRAEEVAAETASEASIKKSVVHVSSPVRQTLSPVRESSISPVTESPTQRQDIAPPDKAIAPPVTHTAAKQSSSDNVIYDQKFPDPETGWMYEYSSTTGKTRWMETADGKRVTAAELNLATESTEDTSSESSEGSYDEVAEDSDTGQMYRYNSRTMASKWMKTPDGKPVMAVDYKSKDRPVTSGVPKDVDMAESSSAPSPSRAGMFDKADTDPGQAKPSKQGVEPIISEEFQPDKDTDIQTLPMKYSVASVRQTNNHHSTISQTGVVSGQAKPSKQGVEPIISEEFQPDKDTDIQTLPMKYSVASVRQTNNHHSTISQTGVVSEQRKGMGIPSMNLSHESLKVRSVPTSPERNSVTSIGQPRSRQSSFTQTVASPVPSKTMRSASVPTSPVKNSLASLAQPRSHQSSFSQTEAAPALSKVVESFMKLSQDSKQTSPVKNSLASLAQPRSHQSSFSQTEAAPALSKVVESFMKLSQDSKQTSPVKNSLASLAQPRSHQSSFSQTEAAPALSKVVESFMKLSQDTKQSLKTGVTSVGQAGRQSSGTQTTAAPVVDVSDETRDSPSALSHESRQAMSVLTSPVRNSVTSVGRPRSRQLSFTQTDAAPGPSHTMESPSKLSRASLQLLQQTVQTSPAGSGKRLHEQVRSHHSSQSQAAALSEPVVKTSSSESQEQELHAPVRRSVASIGFIQSLHSSRSGNFDKMATDPGQMLEYNSGNMEAKWMRSSDGGPVLSDEFKQIIPAKKNHPDDKELESVTEVEEPVTSGGEESGNVSEMSRDTGGLTSAGEMSDSAVSVASIKGKDTEPSAEEGSEKASETSEDEPEAVETAAESTEKTSESSLEEAVETAAESTEKTSESSGEELVETGAESTEKTSESGGEESEESEESSGSSSSSGSSESD